MAQQKQKEQHIQVNPPQTQSRQPGIESRMHPLPESKGRGYLAAGKLAGKVALISGGDSGIGRSVAIHFAKEGADVAIVYLNEHADAKETQRCIEAEGRACLLLPGDIGDEKFCRKAVRQTVKEFGGLNILVNNAAEQHESKDLREISGKQLERTFVTNVFGAFYLTKAALDHLTAQDSIINTASVTAYRGQETLIDYAASKGAIVAFTRSLAGNLVEKGIRVNAVAPGPIWTPLIPASFDAQRVAEHGAHSKFGRPGQPDEVAPCFVFLASADSSYMSGQVLHPNGGEVING